jgi:hypothetical protein
MLTMPRRRRGALIAGPALAALLALAAAAPSGAQSGGSQPFLSGLTSQGLPVLMRFSRDGATLARADLTLRMRCGSGGAFWLPDSFRSLDVSSLGRFSERFVSPPQTPEPGDTTTTTFEGFIRGRVDPGRMRASGTWRMRIVDRDAATGAVTNTCTSTIVRFRVRR